MSSREKNHDDQHQSFSCTYFPLRACRECARHSIHRESNRAWCIRYLVFGSCSFPRRPVPESDEIRRSARVPRYIALIAGKVCRPNSDPYRTGDRIPSPLRQDWLLSASHSASGSHLSSSRSAHGRSRFHARRVYLFNG